MAHYTEMDGWPQEQFGENGQMYCERKLKCAWDDRYTVLIDIAGNGGQLYPYKPDTLAVANGASILPFGRQTDASASPIAVYNHAIITIRYSTGTAVKLSDVWVMEELQPTSRMINVNVDDETWLNATSDPVKASDNIVQLETFFDYVVTYPHLTGIPAAAYANCNKVNSAPVQSYLLGLAFANETLLYPRPIVRRTFDPGLLSTFQLVYRFAFAPHGWNYHFHKGEYLQTTLDPLYKSFNFASLVP